MSVYVGIDNGVSGALVVLSDVAGAVILGKLPMPVQRARKGNEVNIREVYRWLSEVTGNNLADAIYVIEEPGGSKSAKAATSMAGSFHSLRGFFESHQLRYERVTPQAWQRVMIPGAKGEETKARALEVATRLWPGEDWRPTERCRVAHDGMVDAALIAEWARRAGL